MTDVIKFSKKAFTWSVVLMTILWSMGVAALMPASVQAAECPALDPGTDFVVRGARAVYNLDQNLEKRAYQHEKHFRMWRRGEGNAVFSGVVTIDPTCADAYDLPGSLPIWVGPFPGTLVTHEETRNVYVVADGNKAYRVPSEEVAKAFWGSNVFKRVTTILPTYWVNFSIQATDFSGDAPVEGSLVRRSGVVYVMMGGKLHRVEGSMPAGALAQAVDATDAQWTSWVGSVVDQAVTAESLISNPGRTTGSSTPTDPNTPPASNAAVALSLSASTPAGGTVAVNVDNVEFTKVVFKNNGSDAARVTSVRIGRSGLGQVGDFESVTLYDGATKLGNTRTSWTENKYMNYNIPEGWVIPAGASKVLTIKGRLDTAATYNALGVESLTLSGGAVSGLPVFGNEKLGVAVTVGGVTLTGRGTDTQTKKIGSNDVTLAEFRLAMNSVEEVELQSITLENKGTANNDDVANLHLYRGSTKLAGPAQINANDQVSFVLSEPLLMEKSKNYDFKVVGDIVDGIDKTVVLVLDASTDLGAVGLTYKSSVSVTSTDFDANADNGTTQTTIDGAELNISFTSVALDTTDDRDDVEFGRLTLSAGSTDVEISTLIFGIDEENGDADATNNEDVTDFEMVDVLDGSLYSGTMTLGGDNDADSELWTFSDELYLVAGQPRTFILRGDLPAGIGDNDSYRVTSTINTTNVVAETKPGNDAVDNFSIGSFTGKLVTVKGAELTVRSTNMNDSNAVFTEEGVVLFKGSLEASVASALDVDRMKFEGAHETAGNTTEVNANFDEDNWSEIALYTWNKTTGTWVRQQALNSSDLGDSIIDFDDLDFEVPAGAANRVDFEVRGSTKSVFTANTTVHIQLDTVEANDTDGDDPTIVNTAGVAIQDQFELETTRSVTLQEAGALQISMRTTDAGFNKDRIFLAGSGMWVGKLRLRALYEDIMIEDLRLKNANAGEEVSVQSVCLYKSTVLSAENLVACASMDENDVVVFDSINVTVAEGSQDWYIYVTATPMGDDDGDTAVTQDVIELLVDSATTDYVVAKGIGSNTVLGADDGDEVTASGEITFDADNDGTFDEAGDTTTANSKEFTIAGSKITDVSMVSFIGNSQQPDLTVAADISGTSEHIIAILKVETALHSNERANGDALKLALDEFMFYVEKQASTTISGATIQRWSGSSGTVALTLDGVDTDGDTTGTLTLAAPTSSLGADAQIDAGQTAYFVIKGTFNALNNSASVKDFITVRLNSLDTATNNIDWVDGYSGFLGTAFEELLLDKTSAPGIQVDEDLS